MRVSLFRFLIAFAILAVGGYAFVTLRGPKGIPALIEKNRQIELMEKHNSELAQEVERMRVRVKRLNDNPSEQELEIRHRLKLVHPGERVYILGEPNKGAAH